MPCLLHTKYKYHPFYIFIFISPFLYFSFLSFVYLYQYWSFQHIVPCVICIPIVSFMPDSISETCLPQLTPYIISYKLVGYILLKETNVFSVLLKSHKITLRCYSGKVQISHLEYLWGQQQRWTQWKEKWASHCLLQRSSWISRERGRWRYSFTFTPWFHSK